MLASDQISSCLTDIVGSASWKCNVIYHSTSNFLLTGGFKLGSVVFRFLKVTSGCIGVPDSFSCFMKSVLLPGIV